MSELDPIQRMKYIAGESRFEKIQRTVEARQAGLMVVMEDVYNPHNLGAIARSCDAFGVQNLVVIFENQDEFDPKEEAVASASSANKWLDYRLMQGTQESIQALKDEGWYILATVPDRDAPSIYHADLTQRNLALLVGNEHAGVSPEAQALADSTITIPMRGMIESFNVSVATAILLYEITRQRQVHPENFALDEDATRTLMEELVRR